MRGDPDPELPVVRRVLELRVHGINNTTPPAMLDLPEAAIRQVDGDALGAFWRPRDEALAELTERDRGWVPPGVVREAYSWGGLARSSVGGTSPVGKVLAAMARVGWTLLLPLGLVNVAYWSRRLPEVPTDDDGPTLASPVGHGGGAATLRVFGLAMTLLLATTATVIALDLVAVQCFADEQRPCSVLPAATDFIGTWEVPRRLALLSALPMLVVLGLWWLSTVSRSRYERASSTVEGGDVDAATTSPAWPILSTKGFWNHDWLTSTTARLHVATTAAYVTAGTTWHGATGTTTRCRGTSDVRDCWRAATSNGWTGVELALLALCLVLLVLLAFRVARTSEGAADVGRRDLGEDGSPVERGRSWLEPAAAFAFATQVVVLGTWAGPEMAAPRLYGVSAAPAVLVSFMLGIAFSALVWRHRSGRLPLLAALLLAAGLISAFAMPWPVLRAACLAVVLFVGAWLGWSVRRHARDRGSGAGYEAWSGCAPGVLLLLALLLATTLSSGITVAVGNWLNGPATASTLAGAPVAAVAVPGAAAQAATCPFTCPDARPPALVVPRPYAWFGVTTLVSLLLFGALMTVMAMRAWRWDTVGRPSPGDPGPAAAASAAGQPGGPVMMRGGDYPGAVTVPAAGVRSARRKASVAHRAEPAAGLLAAVGSGSLVVALAVAVSGWEPPRRAGFVGVSIGWLLDAGMWALAATGLLVVGLAAGGSALGGKRPLGLVWDLVCFLPRAGHPLGPPCYAERVVPELLSRYRWWLTEEGARSEDEISTSSRGIVVSAHSLGAALAVASLVAAPVQGSSRSPLPRTALLTYGTQLRAYFGRVFPELLGPRVLGSRPCRAADLWSEGDPWHTAIEHEVRASATRSAPGGATGPSRGPSRGSLLDRVTGPSGRPRWRSLWRRTDYLGFPVVGYLAQPGPDPAVDGAAEEVDVSGYLVEVQTHGAYYRVPAYRRALDELTDTLSDT